MKRMRFFCAAAASHCAHADQSATSHSTCTRPRCDSRGKTVTSGSRARLHDAGSMVARVRLVGAAARLAAILRRNFHRPPPRALAAAARRRALAPRPPRAQHARDGAVRCVVQRRARAAARQGPRDDVARALSPAGGGDALRPAAPLADGAVDLPAAQISSRGPTKCAGNSGPPG
jgi:hypothetical protein